MSDVGIDADALAGLLCDWCLEPEPGDQVAIRSTTAAAPLLLALQRALLERDAWPLLRVDLAGADRDFLLHAGDAQLDGFPPLALTEAQDVQRSLRIHAPVEREALAGVPPERIARAARGRERVAEARLARRWCVSTWPTPALAEEAGLELGEYAAIVRAALLLDRGGGGRGAVDAWRELRATQAALIERLAPARELRIESGGTDLRLRVDGRTWVNSDGRRNMPSGEVFTGPLEDSAQGTIRFDVPAGPSGVRVEGVELTFARGEVVRARADVGDDYLQRTLATDPGARRLGELGIGTNPALTRPTGSILLDEKLGGTVHLALGRSYPETGGTNASAVHWDLICDLRAGGTLSADGEPIQRDGAFV